MHTHVNVRDVKLDRAVVHVLFKGFCISEVSFNRGFTACTHKRILL